MSERRVTGSDSLEQDLLELGHWVSYPVVSPAFASRVTGAVQTRAERPARSWLRQPTWVFGRPVRRAVLLAVALLLVLVAVAAAIGFGLPGLRITFGGPGATPIVAPSRSPVPSASPSASPGASMGLGLPVPVAEVSDRVDFAVLLPQDPLFGAPDAAYLLNGRLALVWGPRAGVADTLEPGVSLLISEFDGHLDPAYFDKVLNTRTTLTRISVRGVPGYWISGDPHFFFYVDPSGMPVDDTHRFVGDALLWTDGGVTYRIESSLGRDATIALANAMR